MKKDQKKKFDTVKPNKPANKQPAKIVTIGLLRNSRKFWITTIAVFAYAFLLYANTLSYGYVLDDLIVTTDNKLVQKGMNGIGEIFSKGYYYGNTGRNDNSYRPLSVAAISIETVIWGNNPKVNHFFNVLFYALSCVVLFLLLLKLFKNHSYIIPLLITLLYVAHPIHTEVVANIKSRDEIFHIFFMFLSLKLLMDYVETSKVGFIITSLFSYFLALISKENAITFLAVVPLMLYFFTDLKLKRIAVFSASFLAVAILYMSLRIHFLDSVAIAVQIDVYSNALIAAKTIWERLATNFVIHLKYLQLLFFPITLSWDYSYNQIPIINFSSIRALASFVIFLALVAFGVLGLIKKNLIAFGVLFYFITISIVSNFIITLEATMGERFVFTPSLGFCISLVLLLVYLLKIDTSTTVRNKYLFGIVGAILFLYTIRTLSRNDDWSSDLKLYEADVKASPNSCRTHLALGSMYRDMLKKEPNPETQKVLFNKAISELTRSSEIYPENPEIYYHIGFLYYSLGMKDQALASYLKTIQYKPNHTNVLNYIGIIYTEKGNDEKGIEYFKRTLAIDAKYTHAYNNLAYIYRKQKDFEKALELYKSVTSYEKDNYKAFGDAGAMCFNLGKLNDAIPFYEKAIEINNSYKPAYIDLSSIYKNQGNMEKSNFYAKKANELK